MVEKFALWPMLEALHEEVLAASAAQDAEDWATWADHARKGAELYQKIGALLGWEGVPNQ